MSACKSRVSAHVSLAVGGNTNPGQTNDQGVSTLARVWSVTSQYWDLEGSLAFIGVTSSLTILTQHKAGFVWNPRRRDSTFCPGPHLDSSVYSSSEAEPPAPVSLSVRLKYFSWDIRPGALDWLRWPVFCALNYPGTEFKFSNLSAPNPQWSSSFKSSDWVIQHLLDYKEIAQKLNFWSKVRLIKENDECLLTRYLASNLNSYFMKISYLEHFLLTTKTPKCHQNLK